MKSSVRQLASPVIHLDRNPRGPPPYLIDIGNPGDNTLSHINYTRMCRSKEIQFWSKIGSCDFVFWSEIGVVRKYDLASGQR